MAPGDFLTRHRNAFLITLLVSTLVVGSFSAQHRLESSRETVAIPVMATAQEALSPLEQFRQERTGQEAADIAALQALCGDSAIDSRTREDAANRLQQLIDTRQTQLALEGSLASSSLAPCVAVVAGGSVTIVTGKTDITDRDAALVLSLAAAHAGISSGNVRIMTAE